MTSFLCQAREGGMRISLLYLPLTRAMIINNGWGLNIRFSKHRFSSTGTGGVFCVSVAKIVTEGLRGLPFRTMRSRFDSWRLLAVFVLVLAPRRCKTLVADGAV